MGDNISKNQVSWDFVSVNNPDKLVRIEYVTLPNESYLDKIFINTYTFAELKKLGAINIPAAYIKVAVDSICPEPFDIIFKADGVEKTLKYTPSESSIKNPDYPRMQSMNNPDVSYALLRANPKLTGNVKVVVDSNNNLYLDTFKISQTLSQKKYRHSKVSSTDYYGQNLMAKFKNVPSTDFYKVEDKCYSLFTPAQTYQGEYYDVYRMGAKTNDDKMYSENFSIFAPICLKQYVPDFFIVFKIDKDLISSDGTVLYDEESMDDLSKFNYFLKYGTIVKSYDMREGSNLGDYARTIVERSSAVVGDLYESYDTENSNKYIGISLDRGTVTSIYESVYQEENVNNQVALNEYYTKGFERNHIVSRNILNLEFMFDDPDAELFSLNTYFGLYIKVNSSGDAYSCISTQKIVDEETGEQKIQNIFDRDILTFNSSVHDIKTEIETPILYGISDPNKFIRLNESIYTSDIVSEYALKPYKNLLSSKIYTDTPGNVLTFKLNTLLTAGDHLRIVLPNSHKIYEVICSNTPMYNDEYFCTEDIMNIFHYESEDWNIHRVSLYMDTKINKDVFNDNITEESIILLRDCIINAFRKMVDNSIQCFSLDKFGIGIKSEETAYFERICAPSGFDSTQEEYILETDDEDKSIEFFSNVYPEKIILDPTDTNATLGYFYPINFELVGSRMAYIIKFIEFSDTIYYGEIHDTKVFDSKTLLYKSETNNEYKQYLNIDISYIVKTNSGIEEKTVSDAKIIPFYKNTNYYVFNVNHPKLTNGNLLIYSCYLINDGICSIFNIKDFDFDVLDTNSIITFSSNLNQIGTAGEYSNQSIFEKSIRSTDEESIYDYIDKHRIISYNSDNSENKLSNMLKLYYNENHKSFDISLSSPYSCKWKSIGTDARGENIRLMYDYDELQKDSYYIAGSNTYNEYLGYLYNKDKSGERKYIKNSVSDIISSDTQEYVRDMMLTKNITIDDLIYDVNDNINKYSVVYLSGDNTLEFISAGIKFRVKSTNDNAIDLNNYTGYSAVFVSFPGLNQFGSTDTELIIDEVKREIIIYWYQEAETLAYNELPKLNKVDSIISEEPISLYKTIMPTPFDFDEFTPGYSFSNNTSHRIGSYPDINNLGAANEKLCENQGMVVFNNVGSSYSDFTKYNSLLLFGKICSENNNSSNEYYYASPNKITINDPYFFFDSSWGYGTSSIYDSKLSNYKSCTERLLFTDNEKYIKNRVGTFNKLKTALNNHSVYIKTAEGKKDYTSLNGIIEMSVVEPILYVKNKLTSNRKETGYVHPTYAEPVMKNMLLFEYTSPKINSNSVDNIFGISLQGSNTSVNNIAKISQTWINKYTADPNYCGDNTASVDSLRTSIDVIHDKSILDSAWKKSLYRKYYLDNSRNLDMYEEKYENIDGYITGYEQKNFINSRGVQLKRFVNKILDIQNFDITVWKNTSISYTRNYIRIDISDSIIYKILNDNNFIKAWDYLKLSSNNYKINYIKKTILPLININNKTKLILKRNNISLDRFTFIQDFDDSMIDVINYKNTLKYENGKYYMYIYPEDNYTYSAKMIVDL